MNLNSTYLSIIKEGTSLFKDKGSKHLGEAISCTSKPEAENRIDELRKKHNKANHVCFAYRIRSNNQLLEFSTDDGEPKNSAGPAILGQLKSYELENVLVSVVRYFGGTKLGVSGLINAYKNAANLAIENAIIEELEQQTQLNLKYAYSVYNDVMKLRKQFHTTTIEENNQDVCTLKMSVKSSLTDQLLKQLEKLDMSECKLEE